MITNYKNKLARGCKERPTRLMKKENEQQELQSKLDEVKKLRNTAQTAVEETQDI